MDSKIMLGYSGSLDFFDGTPRRKKWYDPVWTYNRQHSDKSTRSPYYLFRAVSNLHKSGKISPERFEILFWGAIDSRNTLLAERLGISAYLTVKGYLNKQESLDLLNGCSLLFLPLEKAGIGEPLFIPGKLFEYIHTGKPILALCDENSDAGKIVSRSGLGIICKPDDEEAIASKLLEIINDPALLLSKIPDVDYIRQHEWNNVTRKVADVLKSCMVRQ